LSRERKPTMLQNNYMNPVEDTFLGDKENTSGLH
jgi:hypothetical protein